MNIISKYTSNKLCFNSPFCDNCSIAHAYN